MRDLLPLPPSPQGLVVLTGPDACLTVGLLLALQGAIATRPLLVIDGANAFDPYLISDLALSGPRGPLLDEEVQREEAVRVFRQILPALDRVLEWPWTVIAASPDATPPPPGREYFLPQLKRRGRRGCRGAGGGGGGGGRGGGGGSGGGGAARPGCGSRPSAPWWPGGGYRGGGVGGCAFPETTRGSLCASPHVHR